MVSVIKYRVDVVARRCIRVIRVQIRYLIKVFAAVQSTEERIRDDFRKRGSTSILRNGFRIRSDFLRHNVKRQILFSQIGEKHRLVVYLVKVNHKFVVCGKQCGVRVNHAGIAVRAVSSAVRYGSRSGRKRRIKHNAQRARFPVGGILARYGLPVAENFLNVDSFRDYVGKFYVYHTSVKVKTTVRVLLGCAHTHKGGSNKLFYVSISGNNFTHFLLISFFLFFKMRIFFQAP